MTQRSIAHAGFSVERVYPASPARVFGAFSEIHAKEAWFRGPDEWQRLEHTLDFRVGGRERSSVGPTDGPAHIFDAVYYDIVPNERIVYAYEMYEGELRASVSVATIELLAEGEGTRLIMTESGAFLDGIESPEGREHGTNELLDALGVSLG